MRLGSEYILTSSPQANYGYKQDDIVMLTDDASNPRQIPTRDNIVSGGIFAGGKTIDRMV